jgi:hypothetical protein
VETFEMPSLKNKQLILPMSPYCESSVRNNPVILRDPFGLYTLSVGVNFNLQLGPVTIQGNAGLAVDDNGNVAVTYAAGGGVGVGLSSSATLTVLGSNAKTVCDLGGPFANTSVGAGAGLDASVGGFYGQSDHGPVIGAGAGFGIGAGAGTTLTTTSVHPIAGRKNSCPGN